MKKLLLLFFIPVYCTAQIDTANKIESVGFKFYTNPEYPEKDTLSCFFNEYVDSTTDVFKWTSGYVVRERGMFSFGPCIVISNFSKQYTSVTKEYLPLTSGNLLNKAYYKDMTEVKNRIIQVALK